MTYELLPAGQVNPRSYAQRATPVQGFGSVVSDWHQATASQIRGMGGYRAMSVADQAKALQGLAWMVSVIDDAVVNKKNLAYTHQNLATNLALPGGFWITKFSQDEFSRIMQALAAVMARENADVDTRGWLSKAAGDVISTAGSIASPLTSLVLGPVGLLVPDALKSAIENGVVKFTNAVVSGDPVGAANALGSTAWEATKAAAPYVQQGMAFVPGVGPEAAAAMAIGMTLAQGGDMDDALVAGAKAAIPGGPWAAAAFDMGVSLAHGQSLTDSAISSTGKNLVPQNPEAQAAFRAGTAIAKGQNVQETLGREGTRFLMESASGILKEATAPLVKAIAETGVIPPSAVDEVRAKLDPNLRGWFNQALDAASVAATEAARNAAENAVASAVAKFGDASPEAQAVKLGIAAGRGARARTMVLGYVAANQKATGQQAAPVNQNQVIQLARTVMSARLRENKDLLARQRYALKARVVAQELDATKKKQVTGAVVIGVGLAGAATYMYLRKKKVSPLARHA